MRIVPAGEGPRAIPRDARRVGLVGAAVSDHPKIVSIVHALADRGCEVGLSSLRPDRLATSEEFVHALARVGYRTLTTAMDGTSERVRETLERRARPKHLLRCAELAKKHGMDRLKLYLMIGTPGETDADVDECVAFATELSRIVPLALGIAPFCAKRNTPLDGAPFAGIDVVDARLDRLRRGSKGAPTCGRRARAGRGSSTCSRRAARRKGTPSSRRCTRRQLRRLSTGVPRARLHGRGPAPPQLAVGDPGRTRVA